MSFEELNVGDSAEFSKTITETEVVLYAGLTGDFNPVHVDQQAAERSRFGGRVVHGMLTAGLVSAVLGTRLPGPGCVYIEQTLRFTAAVRIGDTITARVQVSALEPKNRVRLGTQCFNHRGEVVLEGEALLLVPAKD